MTFSGNMNNFESNRLDFGDYSLEVGIMCHTGGVAFGTGQHTLSDLLHMCTVLMFA